MASTDLCRIGGFIQFPSGNPIWFSDNFASQNFSTLLIPVTIEQRRDVINLSPRLSHWTISWNDWRCFAQFLVWNSTHPTLRALATRKQMRWVVGILFLTHLFNPSVHLITMLAFGNIHFIASSRDPLFYLGNCPGNIFSSLLSTAWYPTLFYWACVWRLNTNSLIGIWGNTWPSDVVFNCLDNLSNDLVWIKLYGSRKREKTVRDASDLR